MNTKVERADRVGVISVWKRVIEFWDFAGVGLLPIARVFRSALQRGSRRLPIYVDTGAAIANTCARKRSFLNWTGDARYLVERRWEPTLYEVL